MYQHRHNLVFRIKPKLWPVHSQYKPHKNNIFLSTFFSCLLDGLSWENDDSGIGVLSVSKSNDKIIFFSREIKEKVLHVQ